jgi:tetratricopeptide (TPR) repeat protein
MPGGSKLSKRRANLAVGSGIAFWVLALAPVVCAQGTGQCIIRGRVAGPDGRPVEVEVKLLEVTRTVVNSAYSNSNGQFTFQGVADGRYYVTVDSDLYDHAEVSARVTSTIYPTDDVYIALVSKASSDSKAPGGYRNTSKLISVRELEVNFPKKAVKQYEKGNAEMSRGERDAAIRSYQKALALAPGMYPALNNLGNAYLQGKQMTEAESVFRKALAAEPEDGEPYINLGHLYFESRRYDEAEKSLLQGLSRSPNSSMGLFFLGSTNARLGNWQAAETNLQKALAGKDPAVAAAHLELANLYLKTHRQSKAREQLEEFLKERPQDPLGNQVRRTLARLKSQPG